MMKREHAAWLESVGQDLGLDIELREDYSGRGMYGKTTTGLVSRSMDEFLSVAFAGIAAAAYDPQSVPADLSGGQIVSVDSSGTGVIIY